MPSVLTLSDIVGRQIHVEWHESVAVVRALIDTFTAADDRETDFPGLDEIYLSGDGEVSFGGRSMTGEAHRWAGGVLQTLLARTEPPVQLRLVALQATAAVTTLYRPYDSCSWWSRYGVRNGPEIDAPAIMATR